MTIACDLQAPLPSVAELGRVHFIGIGGAGMSGVARILLAMGVPVSGSDAKESPLLAALRAEGAQVGVGHAAEQVDGARTVVVTSAVRATNVELVRAHRLGLRVLHRSQALAVVSRGRQVVAVAGTNGKTTTTSMATVMLQRCGLDPSFSIGGELTESGTNAHLGEGEVFVLEADESDGTFVVYRPQVAVVTNVQPDHLDFYGTAEAVADGFLAFAASVRPGGTLVVCADDEGSRRLGRRAAAQGVRVTSYGAAADADVRLAALRLDATGCDLEVVDHGCRVGSARVNVPGQHNALNAVAGYAAVVASGVAPERALATMSAFTGTRRRFELRGQAGGVRVFDDYAHNPGKVEAALRTGRQVVGQGRLVVVFQPHLYSRTRDFAAGFGRALGLADEVLVMDVYPAREEPLPGVSGVLVAEQVPLAAEQVTYVPVWSSVLDVVLARVRPGDVLLIVGAGDVTALVPQILARLADPR